MSALHAPYPTSSSGSIVIPTLKGAITASTLFIAGGMTATSLQFLPSLINSAQQSVASRPQTNRVESGRLTPNPAIKAEDEAGKSLRLSVPEVPNWPGANKSAGSSSSAHQIAAQQFSNMSRTAFASQVPLELLSIIASGYLAYHYRSSITLSPHYWKKWAGIGALVTAIFPFTGILMVPYDHKLARVAGFEENVETYEDAPPDHEQDKVNTVDFLTQWNTLNSIRAGVMALAGGLGVYTLVV